MKHFTGKEYLFIDIANHYGWDKETWDDRIAWTLETICEVKQPADIEDVLLDIVDEAKDPVLYTKAVRTLRMTLEKQATGFIMGLDATASGLQIMAALIGCHTTARNVNLIDTGVRQDIYLKVANNMNSLLNVNDIDRSLVKKPIMTTFYGSKAAPKRAFGEATIELKTFNNVLDIELPGAMELMSDMQSILDPGATSYKWTMPDGHEVINTIMVPQDHRFEISELDGVDFVYRMKVNGANKDDLSMAANIVHSIDGWIVREMIRRAADKKIQMAAIHDSFWCHPNDMNDIRFNYKEILAEVADSNMMQDILQEITGDPSIQFKKRSHNLAAEIRNAEYHLS